MSRSESAALRFSVYDERRLRVLVNVRRQTLQNNRKSCAPLVTYSILL